MIEKKIALVTGASRGLGAAFAELVAGPNTHVIAVGQTVGAMEELDDRINAKKGTTSLAVMDITSAKSLDQLGKQILKRWHRLDLLIHAAIYAPALSPSAHGYQKELEKALRVNVLATEQLIHCCDPLLKRSSQAGAIFFEDDRIGNSFFGHYACSKSAQIALAKSWQSESIRLGISVQIVAPRAMHTKLRAKFYPGEQQHQLSNPMTEAIRIATNLARSNPQQFDWLTKYDNHA